MAQSQTATSVRTYQIDPAHTTAEFAVKHMMFTTVRGRFGKVEGTILVDEYDPSRSSVEASAETASVDTRDEQRDAHLRSADFFDAEQYPKLTLKSKRVEPKGQNKARVVTDLTIRDVTREVVFDVEYLGSGKDPWGNTKAGFSATAKINRKDFNLVWNVALETGGFLVGDEVTLTLDVQAAQK